MQDLYLKQQKGKVDMYYNDVVCWENMKERRKEIKMEHCMIIKDGLDLEEF